MQREFPAGRARNARLLVTIVISGLNNAVIAAGRLLLPMVALSMGASTLLVGVISALFTAPPMLLSVRFGRWVDRSGALVPMVSASLLIVAACVTFLISPSKYGLLAIAGLIGSGVIFSHVAATRAVVRGWTDEPERVRNLGYLVASYSFFQFLGPVVAGLSFENYGARVAFVAIGAFPILALAGIGLGFHNIERESNVTPDRSARRSALELLALPELRRWLVMASVFAAAQTLYPFVVSLHAVEVGSSAAEAGGQVGAFAVGMLISRVSVAVVTRHFPSRAVLVAALTGGALIYAAVPLLHDAYHLVALSVLLGMSLGLGVPIALALIYGAAPRDRINESVGLCMAMTNFLQTISPLTLGVVASGFGVPQMVWGLSVAMLGAAMMGAFRSKRG